MSWNSPGPFGLGMLKKLSFRFYYRKVFGRTWHQNLDGQFIIMPQEIQLYFACCLARHTVIKYTCMYTE